jgi:hypothetical protein
MEEYSMKSQKLKRYATAMAIATVAVSMTACGSNNNNGIIGVGSFGGALSGSGQCIPLGPTVAFSGTANVTNQGVYAGQNYGQLYMQTSSGGGGGSYMLGRYGSDAMIGINVQQGGLGGMSSIQGIMQFNQTAWSVLTSQLGQYSSPYSMGNTGYLGSFSPYSGYMGGSNLCLTAMNINLGYTTNSGGQYGPFPEVLYGGSVVLSVTSAQGSGIPVTVPF